MEIDDIYEKVKTEKLEFLNNQKKEILKQMKEKEKDLEESAGTWNFQLFNDYNTLIYKAMKVSFEFTKELEWEYEKYMRIEKLKRILNKE